MLRPRNDVSHNTCQELFLSCNPDCQTLVWWKLFTSHNKKKVYTFFLKVKIYNIKRNNSEKNENTVIVHSPACLSKQKRSDFEDCAAFLSLYIITMNGVGNFQALERMWKHHKKKKSHPQDLCAILSLLKTTWLIYMRNKSLLFQWAVNNMTWSQYPHESIFVNELVHLKITNW